MNLLQKRIYYIFIIFFILINYTYSQIAFEPQRNSIYQFLTNLSQKGIVELEDQIMPISRIEMAKLLREAEQMSALLTPLEQKELCFYLKDFSFEMNKVTQDVIQEKYLNYFRNDRTGRWRLFTYYDNFFHVNVSPVIGIVKGQQSE